jgi:hypothetical protein
MEIPDVSFNAPSISEADVDRLLDVVGLPLKTDVAEFHQALLVAQLWQSIGTPDRHTPTAIRRQADAMARHAGKLLEGLRTAESSDDALYRLLGPKSWSALSERYPSLDDGQFEDSAPKLTRLKIELARLIRMLKSAGGMADLSNLFPNGDQTRICGPFDFFLFALALIYETHFGKKPTFSRNVDGELAIGPFLKFALFVTNDLRVYLGGGGISPETVARSLSKIRKRRIIQS